MAYIASSAMNNTFVEKCQDKGKQLYASTGGNCGKINKYMGVGCVCSGGRQGGINNKWVDDWIEINGSKDESMET